jgi:ABC-type uncharacterized transport system involved in gliding motility auxiliary subunit
MTKNRRTFRVTFAVSALLLIAAAMLLTDVFSGFNGARVDLTSDGLYTMSGSAKKILGDLEVPVQVKFYITGDDHMPTELKTLERDVTDKLRDYAAASGGMFEFSVHDPQDDEEMQGSLSSRGMRPFQVQSIDKDEIGVKLIWSSMTIAYKDYPEEIIPQVLPQSLMTLEYELISRVYRLTQERKPVVALVAPVQQVDPQVAMMYLQQGMQPPEPVDVFASVPQLLTQEHYEVKRIDLTLESRIPDDTDVLVVLNPTGFNPRQAFEINRALTNGVNTVIAVQDHIYDYQPGDRGGFTITGHEQTSGIGDMLAALGADVDHRHLFDTSNQVLNVPRTQNVGGLRFQTNEPVRLPMQVWVTESQMNPDAPMTSRIGNLLYLWGSALEIDPTVLANNGLASTTLFTASDNAWREMFNPAVVPGSYFNEAGKPMEDGLPLAALVEGDFPDTFAEQGVPEWPATAPVEGEQGPPADVVAPLAPAPAKLVLTGCAKMFDDMALQAGQNALFLLNAVDALAYGDDLISIRSKTMTMRSIRPVSDGEKLAYRIFAVFLVPLLLVIYGLVRAGARRKEAVR